LGYGGGATTHALAPRNRPHTSNTRNARSRPCAMQAPPFGATAVLKSDMNWVCSAVGRPPSAFNSRANIRPACNSIKSATSARTPSDFMLAASMGLRLPPLGVCHQRRPLTPRIWRCWQTVR
jgi:hypothetical protein